MKKDSVACIQSVQTKIPNPIAGSRGRLGLYGEELLLRLYKKGQIQESELKAGLIYVHHFYLTRMQGHYAHVHFDAVGIDGASFASANDNFTPTELQVAARVRLQQMEQKLGRLAASCFHNVLGLGMSLKDFAHKMTSGAYLGQKRNLSTHQAMGILLSGLGCLAKDK